MAMAGVFLVLIQAQSHPTIEVGEDRLLSVDGPARPLAESQLSANPNNARHLLAVVTQFDSPDGNDRTCVAWTSFDGGREWVRHALPPQGCADPWGVILPDGSAIMVMLGYVKGREDGAFLFRSRDGGRTWPDTPLGLGAHRDHQMVIAQGNQVYVVSFQGVRNSANRGRSTVSAIRSQDGGRIFGAATRVIASNLGYEETGPTLLSDGTFVVGFHDHNRPGSDKWLVRPRSWMLRSTDQGRTFSEPLLVSESCESRGGSCPDTPQNKGVFDPGMTFGAGGDYSGLAASSDGLFHVVWSDARTGIYQLRTATVSVKR